MNQELTGYPGQEPAYNYLVLIHDPCDEEWKSAGKFNCTENCLPALVRDAITRNGWRLDAVRYRHIYPGQRFVFLVDMPDDLPHVLTQAIASDKEAAVEIARSLYGDVVDVCEIIETCEAQDLIWWEQ